MNSELKKVILSPLNLLYKINPELELKILYRIQTGEKLSLKKPMNYNEKLQWLKLNYRDYTMPLCVDKFTVRDFVAERGLSHILNDLLWEGYEPLNIPFSELPDQFVIKVTHGSGFNIICQNKTEIDIENTIKTLQKWLDTKFLPCYGEWYYGEVKPRIIIEKFLETAEKKVPEDYKIFSFNGKPKYIIVDTDRFSGHKRNIYDLEWNLMKDYNMEFPNDVPIAKPKHLNKMLNYASILSKGFPHVRVDFFQLDEEIYFGEMTFSNGSGFDKISPESFNLELGSYIKLDEQMKRNLKKK